MILSSVKLSEAKRSEICDLGMAMVNMWNKPNLSLRLRLSLQLWLWLMPWVQHKLQLWLHLTL